MPVLALLLLLGQPAPAAAEATPRSAAFPRATGS
jgi:hypothetical protein